jgi:hypothetical protein
MGQKNLHAIHWMMAFQLARMAGRSVCLLRGWRVLPAREERTWGDSDIGVEWVKTLSRQGGLL